MAHIFDPRHLQRLEAPERFQWQDPEKTADLLSLKGDERVVDFGCGTGFFSVPIARRLSTGELAAVDISQEMLDYLKKKIGGEKLPVRLIKIDGKTPLPDGWADRILLANILHELVDQPEALIEVDRLLGVEGRLIVIDWLPSDRPVGPPPDDCLSPDHAVNLLDRFDLKLVEKSEDFIYHFALVFGRKK